MLARNFPGNVRFQSVRSEGDVEDFACKADEISKKTYQRAIGAGFVNNLEMREILRAAAQKGALRACVLYIDERPVAFASGILSNKTFCGTFTGYDPGLKRYSPGLQAMMRLIEELFETSEGLLRFDAGSGDSPYKRRLFDYSRKECAVWIFAPTAKGLSLHIPKLISTLLHSFAMRLLAKSDYLRRVRKMWRERALREFQRNSSARISR
jgi:CelD/BcsL family acetyltransferase involved in cellulose biosynthesis